MHRALPISDLLLVNEGLTFTYPEERELGQQAFEHQVHLLLTFFTGAGYFVIIQGGLADYYDNIVIVLVFWNLLVLTLRLLFFSSIISCQFLLSSFLYLWNNNIKNTYFLIWDKCHPAYGECIKNHTIARIHKSSSGLPRHRGESFTLTRQEESSMGDRQFCWRRLKSSGSTWKTFSKIRRKWISSLKMGRNWIGTIIEWSAVWQNEASASERPSS